MLLTVQADLLKTALNKILTVVDKKNSRPILTYTLIEARADNTLNFFATDLEISSKVTIKANVNKPGTCCVNAKNISDILKEFPAVEINFSVNEKENTLNIFHKDIDFSLLVYKSDDFPKLTFSSGNKNFELTAKQILNIINKTSHAVSIDETRLYLNGIFIQEISNDKLLAVSTDGYRLALLEQAFKAPKIDSLMNGVIIPKKGVFELKKIAENFPEAIIKICVDDSFIYINANDADYLSIRLIARDFPKHQSVIPSKTSYSLRIEKDSILNALKRIRIMANEKTNGVKIKLLEKEIIISANHPSLGKASEKVSANYAGKEMEVGFNAKYLIDVLSVLEDSELLLEFNNEFSPVVVKTPVDNSFLGIVMPLKL